MRYTSTADLPFNSRAIESCFQRSAPGDLIPAGIPWYVVIQGNSLVVEESAAGFSLLRKLPDSWGVTKNSMLFLGLWQGDPLCAVHIGKSAIVEPPLSAEPYNAVAERLDDRLMTIGGFAQQSLHWERVSSICALCGGATEWITGNWGKRCLSCSSERYPSVHPCAIVLVKRGDEFLLVRKPEWGEGRYGLVAGFLDFGESLEECAAREVKEETGIDVCNVQYVGSQSWPFPSQLMAGFVADYAGGDIVVDTTELIDARWFSRNDPPSSFPPHRSIARWIIEKYALQE